MRATIALALTSVLAFPAFAQPVAIRPHGFLSGLDFLISGRHLMIRCADGKQRPSDGACLGTVVNLYIDGPEYFNSYKVNTSTGVVMETTGSFVDGQFKEGAPSFLSDCRVADTSNWECERRIRTAVIDDGWYEGMRKGRAYYYATTNGSPDYEASSISGLGLFLFEAGFLSAEEAAHW